MNRVEQYTIRFLYLLGLACMIVGSFLHLFRTRHIDGLRTTYGTVWTTSGAAALAVLVAVTALVLAGAIVRGVHSPAVPIVVAVLALLGVLALAFKPGTGSPHPRLAVGGVSVLAALVYLLVVAAGHGLLLRQRR